MSLTTKAKQPEDRSRMEDWRGFRVALFPISLSNQRYSSEHVIPLIRQIPNKYERLIFLIADQLQLYNKAMRVPEVVDFGSMIEEFRLRQVYIDQRARWLQRVRVQVSSHDPADNWEVVGINDVADDCCFKIYRNVLLAYYTQFEFHDDVNESAHQHAITRNDRYSLCLRENLSRSYILEEVALSVRLHISKGVSDEYYVGDQAKPITKLYNSEYSFSVFDLAEMPIDERVIRFYEMTDPGPPFNWQLRELKPARSGNT